MYPPSGAEPEALSVLESVPPSLMLKVPDNEPSAAKFTVMVIDQLSEEVVPTSIVPGLATSSSEALALSFPLDVSVTVPEPSALSVPEIVVVDDSPSDSPNVVAPAEPLSDPFALAVNVSVKLSLPVEVDVPSGA